MTNQPRVHPGERLLAPEQWYGRPTQAGDEITSFRGTDPYEWVHVGLVTLSGEKYLISVHRADHDRVRVERYDTRKERWFPHAGHYAAQDGMVFDERGLLIGTSTDQG